jgi:hypothetical protein
MTGPGLDIPPLAGNALDPAAFSIRHARNWFQGRPGGVPSGLSPFRRFELLHERCGGMGVERASY